MEEAEGNIAIAIIEEGFALAGTFNIADFVPWLSYWDPQRIYARTKRLVPQQHGFMRACVEERRELLLKTRTGFEKPEELKTRTGGQGENADVVEKPEGSLKGHETALVDALFEIEGEGEDQVDKDEMLMLAIDMMMAGTDTTSKTVEWALAELAQHPDMLERLRAEVDEAYASGCSGSSSGCRGVPVGAEEFPVGALGVPVGAVGVPVGAGEFQWVQGLELDYSKELRIYLQVRQGDEGRERS
ncbi:unnamed protein product [Closterium sp. Naga37s-1]|nr:unnamed protein product [Closterium sp. Naga37s-1]